MKNEKIYGNYSIEDLRAIYFYYDNKELALNAFKLSQLPQKAYFEVELEEVRKLKCYLNATRYLTKIVATIADPKFLDYYEKEVLNFEITRSKLALLRLNSALFEFFKKIGLELPKNWQSFTI